MHTLSWTKKDTQKNETLPVDAKSLQSRTTQQLTAFTRQPVSQPRQRARELLGGQPEELCGDLTGVQGGGGSLLSSLWDPQFNH